MLKATLERCDRTRSAEARETLRAVLWRRLSSYNIPMATDCSLAPHFDILSEQEAAKRQLSENLWMCNLCGKRFRSNHYLDKHLARKHPHVRAPAGRICFADLCGIFTPCFPLTPNPLPSVSTRILMVEDGLSNGTSATAEITSGFYAGSVSPCSDEVTRLARRQACSHAVRVCLRLAQHTVSAQGALHHRRYFERHLCKRAPEVECTPRDQRWRAFGSVHSIYGHHDYSLRATLGWILVLCAVIVAVLSQWMSRTRTGRPDLVRRRRRKRRPR